jgi:hypothetical protein
VETSKLKSRKKEIKKQIDIVQLARFQNEQKFPDADLRVENKKLVASTDKLELIGKRKFVTTKVAEDIKFRVAVKFVERKIAIVEQDSALEENLVEATEITAHYFQETANIDDNGSACCFVRKNGDKNFLGLVTAGHIIAEKEINDLVDIFYEGKTYEQSGKIIFLKYSENEDCAIIEILNKEIQPKGKQFTELTSTYDVDDEVTVLSNLGKERNTKIKDVLATRMIDGLKFNNITTLIKTNPKSKEGDSGGCVFLKNTTVLVGMLIGGNDVREFVLPINNYLINYKLC